MLNSHFIQNAVACSHGQKFMRLNICFWQLLYCNNLFFAQFTGNTYFHPLPLGVDVNLGLAVQSSWTCLLKI